MRNSTYQSQKSFQVKSRSRLAASAKAKASSSFVTSAAVCARPREIDVRSACVAASPEVENAWAAYRSTDQFEECRFSDACWRRKDRDALAGD